MLLSKGADINGIQGRDYSIALQAASGQVHKEIVKMLLSKGADKEVDEFSSSSFAGDSDW